MPGSGIFIMSELAGPAADRIHELQRRYDPKLARAGRPHVTLVGSSGVGPVAPDTSVEALRRALEPIAADTAPMELPFGPPVRFMQTTYVVLPLDPHGPLRDLHERIRASGLRFGPVRFTFTPHATLSFYRELPRDRLRELLAVRVPEPAVLGGMQVYFTSDPQRARLLLDLPFGKTHC